MTRSVVLSGLALVALLEGLAGAATISVPEDHATIQDAIGAAQDGDVIEVAPETPDQFGTPDLLGAPRALGAPFDVSSSVVQGGAGACCDLDGACLLLTELACTSGGSRFVGAGTSCATTDCPIPGQVLAESKISDTQGNFDGVLDGTDNFGGSITTIGDLDGDGVLDLVVGAIGDDDGATAAGAVWVLFMNADGTVSTEQKISATSGGFGGELDLADFFGVAVASLGDLDGDGVNDLAVGAYADDDGGPPLDANRGAVWILFLNGDGTVKNEQKISATFGGFGGALDQYDLFGVAVAALGDLDGDGVNDLAVGAHADDDGQLGSGAVWILFLNDDGTVKNEQKISATSGGFGGTLDLDDSFGVAVAALGDLDGDGVNDLAVGAFGDDDGAQNKGAVWILFLASDGTVKSEQKISDTEGSFSGVLDEADAFGAFLARAGDLDLDGVVDLAVGVPSDDDGGPSRGAVWILFLNDNGTVKGHRKISSTSGGFGGAIDNSDFFGPVGALGDFDGDGRPDIAVGAVGDDDGEPGNDKGAVWLLSLDGATSLLFDPPLEVLAAGAGDFVATGDLDSDGDDDAVIVIPGTNPLVYGHVQVFLNQGVDGTSGWLGFVANPVITVGRQPSGVSIGLFDNDADLDLAVANAADANVTILLNTGAGNGSFVFDQNIAVGLEPQAIAAGDYDNAPPDDLAVANAGDDNVMIITNVTPSPLGGEGAERSEAGEGLLVGSAWLVSATIPVGDLPVALEPEDVDNDKDLDLIVANRNAGTVTFLFLDSGAPGTSQVVTVGGLPTDVAAADIDDNGFSDAAVAIESDDVVAVIPNGGGGALGAPETIDVGVGPEWVGLADLDNDGDPDLGVVAQDANVGPGVQVFENLGEPGGSTNDFGTPLGYTVGADPNYAVSADLDGDGRIDLVTANTDPEGPTGGSVSVLLNLACSGDTDGSGGVGFGDLTQVLLNWGPCPAPPANCPWDLDHNGDVGFNDVVHVLVGWGACD